MAFSSLATAVLLYGPAVITSSNNNNLEQEAFSIIRLGFKLPNSNAARGNRYRRCVGSLDGGAFVNARHTTARPHRTTLRDVEMWILLEDRTLRKKEYIVTR